MKKELLSVFLIWTILFVSIGIINVSAQTVSKDKNNETGFQNVKTSFSYNFKENFKKNLSLSTTNVLDAPIDFDKIRKENPNNLPVPKRKMSKQNKIALVLVIIGAAALTVFLVKNWNPLECVREDPNCQPGESCICLEFKE